MRFNDLAGQRFGRLVVLRRAENNSNNLVRWHCRCDCGQEKPVLAILLRKGRTKSCGCFRVEHGREHGARINLKHGEARNGRESSEYRTWASMVSRCHNPGHKNFPNYGGRGIAVCDRWRENFEAFLADMGRRPAPKLSLDRIDNMAGYSPENCRWATYSEQNNNKRPNRVKKIRLITIDDETFPLVVWLGRAGVSTALFYQRVSRGWTEERAILEPRYDASQFKYRRHP